MEYFFMIIDYLIPVLMIVSYPWWMKIANGEISKTSGFRTSKSMSSKENWKTLNKTSGKYSLIFGIILFAFTLVMRKMNFVTMEIMSLIIVTIQIISMFAIVFMVNKKL